MKFILTLWLASLGMATTANREAIWDTRQKTWLQLQDVRAKQGEIFILGEEHATPESISDPKSRIHHTNQVRWLKHLKTLYRISVGMEFIAYPFQSATDAFVAGSLAENDFLREIGWGGNPFSAYREQILASRDHAGTLALNAPRALGRKVAQLGPAGLTPSDQQQLPPIWERGSADYFSRFQEIMQNHIPAHKLENYFWAQSLWDDTMAWKALQRPQDTVLTVIVGAFHSEFGHGLPARIKRYGHQQVTTVLQIPVEQWDSSHLNAAIAPDPRYGEHADLLWLYFLPGTIKTDSQP